MLARMGLTLPQLVVVTWLCVGALMAGLAVVGNIKPKAVREACQTEHRLPHPDDVMHDLCR
jgi:hypothetical protein